MVTSRLCLSGLSLTAFLVAATLALAAQQPDAAAHTKNDFLPAGPFLFEPGTIHPTYMDAFNDRPDVKSPDGKLGLTVTGPKKSWGAWVTIFPSKFPDGPVQVWPIQGNVDVLWRPDSRAFALTDNRYANHSYVIVCGTEFRMGESGEGLGVPITDLTPVIQKAFAEPAQKYYGTDDYDTLSFYAKVLRWVGKNDLLVGISAMTSGPTTFPNRGLREWNLAYLVNVPNREVLREVDKKQLLSEYKIAVQH
jgi:hypothetical protein